MPSPHSRLRSTLTVIAFAAALVLPPALNAPNATAASYSTPSGLKAVTSARSIALSWTAVKGAPAYRVQFSTKSNMSGAKTTDVATNYIEWDYLNPDPSKNSGRLKPNTKYYFKVRVVTKNDLNRSATGLTKYSSRLTAKTQPSSSWPYLAPVGLRATAQSPTSEYLSWSSRGPGVSYQVEYSTQADFGVSRQKRFDYSGGVLDQLSAGTRYYFRVKVITTAGATSSKTSAAQSFTTTTTDAAPSAAFKLASYNICSWAGGCFAYAGWDTRRELMARSLATQAPDLIAMQEANRSPELMERLSELSGRDYRVVSYSDHAELGYNADRFALDPDRGGVHAFTNDQSKNLVWAVFTDRISGRKIFAVSVHMTNSDSASAQANRIGQAKEVVDTIAENNPDNLPVVIGGDFNVSKRKADHPKVYSTMTGAGFIDSLGNPSDSRYPDQAALAAHRIDVDYASANQYQSPALRSQWANGYCVDYLWRSTAVELDMVQTVVDLNTSRKFTGPAGRAPSDHNLITAWMHLK